MKVTQEFDIPIYTFVSKEHLVKQIKEEITKLIKDFEVEITEIVLDGKDTIKHCSFSLVFGPKKFDRLGHEVYEKEETR